MATPTEMRKSLPEMATPADMRKSLSKVISYTVSAIICFGLLFAIIAMVYLPYYYDEFSDVEIIWSFLGFNIPISEHHVLGSPFFIALIIVAISVDIAFVTALILNFFGNMKIKLYETTYATYSILSRKYAINTYDPGFEISKSSSSEPTTSESHDTVTTWQCKKCKALVNKNPCPECGFVDQWVPVKAVHISNDTIACPLCNTVQSIDKQYCINCGQSLHK